MENKISIQISEADELIMNNAYQTIRDTFKKYGITLSSKDRQDLPKMADGTEAFVQKALELAGKNPQFMPPFMDLPEMKKDLDAYFQIKPFVVQAKQSWDEFSDTAMEAGSEAYVQALAFYNSIKLAVKMKIPGAKAIYEELRKRFEVSSKASSASED